MRLMTEKLEKRFDQVGTQEGKKDPVIIAKFFNPVGAGTWYATEYDPKTETFFGYASIFGDENDEWGYFSLKEFELYQGPWDLGIERDLFWTEAKASSVIP